MNSLARLHGRGRGPLLLGAILALSSAGLLVACAGDEAAVTDETGEGAGGDSTGQSGAPGHGGTAGHAAAGASGASGRAGAGAASTGGAGAGASNGTAGAGGDSASGGADQGEGGAGASDPGEEGGAAGATDPGGDAGAGGAGGDPTGTGGTGPAPGGTGGTAGTGTGTAGAPSGGGGQPGAAGSPGTAATEVEMTFTTANIGRDYNTKANVAAVFDKIGDVLDNKSGPRFIGWQEIGEADPCGSSCEIEALEARFKGGWNTRRPKGKRPDGGMEIVKVPVTSAGAEGSSPDVRAVYASAGWAGVSPTRFVTVVYYPQRNVSVVNTHLIAGAWSCAGNQDKRREYWKDGWAVYKAQVAKEHQAGHNVIATGDLNRPRGADSCNPAWQPSSLHADAKVIGGAGIDYVFAVPANGRKFVTSKKGDGTDKEGTITLGIDGHKAHWVSGKFLPK